MGLRTRLLAFLLFPTVLTIGGFAVWRIREDQFEGWRDGR